MTSFEMLTGSAQYHHNHRHQHHHHQYHHHHQPQALPAMTGVTEGSFAPSAGPPAHDEARSAEDWCRIMDSVPIPPDSQLLDLLNSLDLYQDEDTMNSLCNDMLFSDLGSDQTHHLTTDLPQAMRVSMSGGDEEGLRNLLTPPESPVFAELTTPGNHLKGVAHLFHDAVVPNLKYEPIDACNLNTMCSPLYQDHMSFNEGIICDVPFGTSGQVLPKEETDFNEYFPGGMADSLQWHQAADYMDIEDYTTAHQQMPTFDCPNLETLPNVEMFLKNLTECQRPLPTSCPLRGQNSAGEETECESESSFTLCSSPAIADDGVDLTASPLPPHPAARTHNYQRKTVDKSVSLFCGVTSKSHKRGRGRPRKMHSLSSNSSDDSDEEVTTRRGRGRREAMRGNHLWEFIRDLLKDTAYCPKYIRFENRKEGVFRFVNSEAVAKLWGRKKNNPNMTYEKLSRAMRYYYKREILERVDGRRLVYKFGKNATGWKEVAGYSSDTESS